MKGGLRFRATGTEISNPNFTIVKAARAAGVCPRAVRKWVARYRENLAARTRPRQTRGVYQTTQSLIDPAGFWVLKAQRKKRIKTSPAQVSGLAGPQVSGGQISRGTVWRRSGFEAGEFDAFRNVVAELELELFYDAASGRG
jgi:hypothetical protein